MKICPNCNAQLNDEAVFCPSCGQNMQPQNHAPTQPTYTPRAARVPYDHTHEFNRKDISDNKVIAMLVYLMGAVGILIAALLASNSAYAGFHVRQALKITVAETLMWIVAGLLCWTFIVPIAAACISLALVVIRFICFFQICSGKAVEPAIIRDLNFLK